MQEVIKEVLVVLFIWAAMMATSMWESSSEGRNAWNKHKLGWKIKIGNYVLLTRYHFFLFWVMIPALLIIPLILDFSWKLFWLITFSYSLGIIIQDFGWYICNPVVKYKEFYTSFSDYYPWIKIKKKKIIPIGYLVGIVVGFLSLYIFSTL